MIAHAFETAPRDEFDRIAVYHAAVRRHFANLKRTTRYDQAAAKSIPIGDGEGYLFPVCDLHRDDEALIEQLSAWRDAHQYAYPTRFKVTHDGTKRWLGAGVLDVEDRLMFLVLDRHGRPVGHVGFGHALSEDASIECDNWLRGVDGVQPGLMGKAVQTSIAWAQEMLQPLEIYLRAMADNENGIRFHQRAGFVHDTTQPLRRHEENGVTVFKPVEAGDHAPADAAMVRMLYRPGRTWTGEEMILTAGPTISSLEMGYAFDAARNGWNRDWGRYLKQFEEEFARYIGVKHAIATSSGTGALHLAMLGLGVGPGDEVIVPDLTWVATGNAVVYAGATPVFADVQPDSWCIDPDSIEGLITERTKAIMPVHLYGHPAQMDAIMRIAQRHGLKVVEDAAPAIGAEFRGRKVGTFGDFAMFSFQGAKLAVTGEGGMLVTNDDALYERVYSIWDQGRVPGTFWINETGWKYKMANIQAALGLGQIERADELIAAKRKIFGWYEEGLLGVPGIKLAYEADWARSIYWMTSITVEPEAKISRDQLRERLHAMNVDTRSVFPAISQYPMWPRPQAPRDTAKRIGDTGINLPSGHRLREEQVEYVCRCVRQIIEEARAS